LTIFSLGGSPADLQRAYSNNCDYQRLALPVKSKVVAQLSEPETFKACLGREEHYGEFLRFFQSEMEKYGWQRVVNTYLFASTSISNDLFGRLFAGLLHPLIHLGFGIEFEQPAIIAEALSQAAVHENWTSAILWKCEEALKRRNGPSKSLLQILDEIRDDKAMHDAVRWEDDNKLRDGLMVRAPDHAANIVSQWSAEEGDLVPKTLEMMSAVRKLPQNHARRPSINGGSVLCGGHAKRTVLAKV
jgi:Questin oxidase-like